MTRTVTVPWWRRRAVAAVVAVVVVLVGIARMPVTTRQGLNFEVSTHRLPLYVKSLQFVTRSAHYQQIADEIASGATSDVDRAVRVFEWTRRHIRPTPEGWPVVDDHILNIIIRGHGLHDQQADVFTTLATYAGVPAFWAMVPPDLSQPRLVLSFAQIEGRWRVFDVARGFVFRTAGGDLATLEEVAARPALLPDGSRPIDVAGIPYSRLMAHAVMPSVPRPLRAELQMPMPRAWFQVKKLLGAGGAADVGPPRRASP